MYFKIFRKKHIHGPATTYIIFIFLVSNKNITQYMPKILAQEILNYHLPFILSHP